MKGIYTITNLVNNKIYVGLTSNLEKRWEKHRNYLRSNKHINKILQHSWNKYGEENFVFEILEECSEDFLYSQEHYWCNMLNTHDRNYGYNIQPTNPNGVWGISEETRKKIATTSKGRIHSPETREKISKKLLGHPGFFTGETHTEESKRKISKSNKGRIVSKKSREKLSKSHTGKTLSKITKNKIRLGNIGKVMSKENRILVSKRVSKPVLQLDLNNNFIKEWKSVTEAKNHYGGDIPAVLKNRQKQSSGFIWKYKENG